MIVVDGHLDLAMNAPLWNRDLTLPVATIRGQEAGMKQKGRGAGTVALPELRRREVVVCLATVIARVERPGSVMSGYRTHAIAHAHAQGQLAYYRQLERDGAVRLITDVESLDAHLAMRRERPGEGPLGVVLCMEGADPIVDPSRAAAWYGDGLRVVGLAHYGPSAYAHGTGSPGPLTPAGRELLAEMDRLGMILDLAHLAEASFDEALGRFRGTVIASHCNCRALVPGDRQLSDDMIRRLAARGGVVGAVMDAWMLIPGWVRGVTTNEDVTLERVVDHIDHVCQIAGDAGHAAIGTDLDGAYGTEQCPRDLDTIADLQRIPQLLRRRGYTEDDVEGIMHGNWLRLLRQAWGRKGGSVDRARALW